MNESELRQLVWRSRRGLLELDLLLAPFVQNELPRLDSAGLEAFREVLLLPDHELWSCLNGKVACLDARLVPMIERIRATQQSQF